MTQSEIQKMIETEVAKNGMFSSNKNGSQLRERNKAVIKRTLLSSPENKKFRESFKRSYGFDPLTDTEKFPVNSPDFSWTKVREKIETSFKEADSSSTFTQFLRAGIQAITNAMYESVATTYEDWVTVVQSGRDTELYAPNHGVSFPVEVPSGGKYPEVGVAALDIQLKNRKFGSMYNAERELIEDDQTGSFQRQASLMGEYLKVLSEVYCYGKLASLSGGVSYSGLTVPKSETAPSYESSYPWSTALRGGGKTKGASPVVLNQANIQTAMITLYEQLNLQGLRMNVNPKRLLISPHYTFDASVLLHSAYYPSGAAAAGNTGGAFAINPIKGLLDISVSRFMPNDLGSVTADSKAWYVIDDSKPWFILQLREAVGLEQENPTSGRSFDEDILRWKGRTRLNADHIDPRFAYQGSDGSV